MGIRVIGSKKCNATKKVQRFFKERNIDFQFVDINKGDLKAGELGKAIGFIGADELIDENSTVYKKKGFQYMDFDAEEELLENQLLLKTPVVRDGNKFFCNPDETVLAELAGRNK